MTITPSNNESKGAPTRNNFITPQDCKLIVDQVRDDVNAHLAMLTGTVSLKVLPHLPSFLSASPKDIRLYL